MSLLETLEFAGVLGGLAILMWDNCLAVRNHPPARPRTKPDTHRRATPTIG